MRLLRISIESLSLRFSFPDMMESICDLGNDDVVRVCSAIFEVLGADDVLRTINLTQTNYLKKPARKCSNKFVTVDDNVLRMNALKCLILQEDFVTSPIHIVADPRERGSAFVISGESQVYARITKIGGLLHPLGPKEVQLRSDSNRGSGSDAWLTRPIPSRRRSRANRTRRLVWS